MQLVRVKKKYQVTIPTEIRQKLALKVGDVLETELQDNRIILKPKMLVDKNEAWQRLMAVLDEVHRQNKQFSPEEVERDVLAAIQKIRVKRSSR